MDDELNEEEKEEIEKYAAAHPHVQQELNFFLQTKLQPEEIVFRNKEVLYKKERVSVISMLWWRVAVAAVLVIAAGITLYPVFNKNNSNKTQPRMVRTKAPVDPIAKPPLVIKNGQSIEKENEQVIAAIPEQKKHKKENIRGTQTKRISEKQEHNPGLANNSPGPRKKAQVIGPDVAEKTTKTNRNIHVGDKMHKENFNGNTVTNQSAETPQPVYVNNTESKKFRGFFRKATRLIERATNINPANDDNKVLIGGMAFNLK